MTEYDVLNLLATKNCLVNFFLLLLDLYFKMTKKIVTTVNFLFHERYRIERKNFLSPDGWLENCR